MRRSMAESRRESRQTNRRKPPFDKGTYDYNHGLPGVGNKPWRLGNRKTEITLPDVQGEVLFGLYPVLLAIQEGRRYLNRVFVKKGAGQETLMKAILKAATVKGVEVHECEAAELDFLSKNRQHQGVCLDAIALNFFLHSVDSSEEPRLWVILDRIQDPMNFGAVLRSCYYLGVHRVITSSKEGCALSPVVCKASAGALELAPLFKTSNLTDFIQAWREKGFRILGTGMPTEGEACSSPVIPLNTIDMQQDTILIFGNEGKGMDTELISLCDALLTISPRKALHQSLDSLNVSVAAGIVLHHLLNTKCTQL
ncbi:hypothetical protein CAPTEDRAFT_169258 [Capitella teleta]|uniref:rRNA methyltransferase 1, mitochondrial n=1 Tax=Capitella teleta TaxID=283909 RepID=R7UFL1_CAPTE|nr:hypothetical protein CAPTEDRAFT_169258 [Capitella teleta]|eukprot:ELU02573.1 hypothetical protein CAPTEDRAFT_169258 [Capitella teleta]